MRVWIRSSAGQQEVHNFTISLYSSQIIYIKKIIPGWCVLFSPTDLCVHLGEYLSSLEECLTNRINVELCLEFTCVSLPTVPFFVMPVHTKAI